MKAPPEVVFAQNLASNDKIIRDRAVKKLKKWLGSRAINGKFVSEEEMMKIWKGLHYCYWMSDKPLIQEELADNIANIVACFKHEESSLCFFKCFLVTIGREWFGIDRLRMDKFMMLVRRCLRQALAFIKDNAWEVALVEKLTGVLKQDVMMAEARDTSLGFQLHVADVFLEELAKIGADSVSASTVTVFLQPFIEVLVSGKEDRLRDHVAERIFHHLIRQSDPGIEWAVNEEMGDADLNGDEDLEDMEEGKDDDEEDKDDDEEDIEDDLEVDPRAGGVDVTLPQIQVDYQGLATMLFDLGSGSDVRKANRELLYKLSKNFKDVTQEVFPLGADLDLDQEIEKISLKKAAKRLTKFNDDYQKKNLENKIALKSIMKERKKKQVDETLKNGEENGCESSYDLTNGNSNQNGLKRSSEEESDDEPVEKKSKADDKDEAEETTKFDYKEKRKKQKQEQKKRKRERKLQEEADIAEKERKAQLLLEKDLNFKIALDGEKKTTEIKSTDSEVKVDTPVVANSGTSVELNGIEQTIAVKNVLSDEKKEKPKKKKKPKGEVVPQNGDVSDITTSAQAVDVQQSESNVKMKKKNKKDKEKVSKDHGSLGVEIKIDAIESQPAQVETAAASQIKAKIVKKKKIQDTFRELAKGDESDITVHDDSQSAIEILKKKKKKKKDKSKKIGSEGSDEKVEEKRGNLIVSGEENSDKVFEESDWDSPLKPGEVEVVLPNKKYKGKDKLKAANEAQEGFPGFDPPSISKTTPKTSGTMTASFLKKAMSKSASPKLKRSKLEKLKKLETLTMSEPKKKKVNFALTMNKAQDINAFITSIASSPSIPHDPNKQPSKPLLSGQDSTPDSTKRNSVALNTQINSKSKTAKKLGALSKKKLRAMDFF